MQKIYQIIHNELLSLKAFNESNISWSLAITAATVIVIPLLIGIKLNQLNSAMVVAMGSMVFLYFPKKSLSQRLNILIVVALGMQASLLFGLLIPATYWWTLVSAMTSVVFLSIWLCRAFQLNAPGALYFIITACVAILLPLPLSSVPKIIGLFAIGNIWAILMAILYSLVFLSSIDKKITAEQAPQRDFIKPIADALLIAIIMGCAMSIATSLQLQRPYWVPICCMSVLQMPTPNLAWQRLWQMVISSSIGLFLVWLSFLLPINNWIMCIFLWFALIMTLWLLLRHYFLTMVFITPMTIFFVEFSVSSPLPSGELILIRWIDILIGVCCGMAGHFLLNSRHAARLRRRFEHAAQARV